MDNTEVEIATLALLGAAITGLIWIIKFVLKTFSKVLQEHTKAALKQVQASEEVLTFMKNLNGKLEAATVQKAEQRRTERNNKRVRAKHGQ